MASDNPDVTIAIKSGALRSGWKTSEFWLTLIGLGVIGLHVLRGDAGANMGDLAIAVMTAVYGASRAHVKATDSNASAAAASSVTSTTVATVSPSAGGAP